MVKFEVLTVPAVGMGGSSEANSEGNPEASTAPASTTNLLTLSAEAIDVSSQDSAEQSAVVRRRSVLASMWSRAASILNRLAARRRQTLSSIALGLDDQSSNLSGEDLPEVIRTTDNACE